MREPGLICNRKPFPGAIIIFCFCLFLISPACASDHRIVSGTVTRVSDGDTVVIRRSSGKLLMCRLYGIDAPEVPAGGNPGQPFGRAADRELSNLVLNTTVHAELTGDSSYDREICIIRKKGVDINREMVRRGYAWAYREFLQGPYVSGYIDAESEARSMRRGFWVQPNPQPPWEFRKKL